MWRRLHGVGLAALLWAASLSSCGISDQVGLNSNPTNPSTPTISSIFAQPSAMAQVAIKPAVMVTASAVSQVEPTTVVAAAAGVPQSQVEPITVVAAAQPQQPIRQPVALAVPTVVQIPATAVPAQPGTAGITTTSESLLIDQTLLPLPDLSTAYGKPLRRIPVLGRDINQEWTLEQTWGMRYLIDANNYPRVDRPSIQIVPYAEDLGRLFLTVRYDSKQEYLRERIVGISFWISGGETPLYSEEIAVTITGSDFTPIYRWDDRSVLPVPGLPADSPVFSETRLNYLGIDEIPPHTWVEVVLWLDDRIYDPPYTYVTGIYFRSTDSVPVFYLDDIALLEEVP